MCKENTQEKEEKTLRDRKIERITFGVGGVSVNVAVQHMAENR